MEVTGYSVMNNRYNTKVSTEKAVEDKKDAAVIAAAKDETEKAEKKQDTFEKVGNTNVTYTKPKAASAQQLMQMEQQRMNSFSEMLRGMIVKQGQKGNLQMMGMNFNVTPADSAKAAASIADGGEYSVDAVAGRIMDMAKALSGGDAGKLEELRTAVQKGFKAAGKELGVSKQPSITNDTYNEVMKRFDAWKNEGKTSVTE